MIISLIFKFIGYAFRFRSASVPTSGTEKTQLNHKVNIPFHLFHTYTPAHVRTCVYARVCACVICFIYGTGGTYGTELIYKGLIRSTKRNGLIQVWNGYIFKMGFQYDR